MEQVSGWSEQGGSVVTVPGTQGSGAQRFQQSFRGATVTVRDSSNNLATIYSDDLASPTAKANPFTASSTTGAWNFFTTTGTYTLTFSGGSILAPFSITVNVGLGNAGGVPSYAFASLPTSKTQNAGDIARVTNTQGGLWMDSGIQWVKQYPLVNVREAPFNARGDDSNDDTAELQAALDSGASVFIPAGTYKITAPLTLTTTDQLVFGAGAGLSIIKNYGNGTDALSVTSRNILQNFSIDGSGHATSGKGIAISGSTFYNQIIFVEVESCSIGVDVDNCNDIHLVGCFLHDNRQYGFKNARDAHKNTLYKCLVQDNGNTAGASADLTSNAGGIFITGGYSSTIRDCVIQSNNVVNIKIGSSASSVRGLTIDSNYIEGTGNISTVMNADIAVGYPVVTAILRVRITNNHFSGTDGVATDRHALIMADNASIQTAQTFGNWVDNVSTYTVAVKNGSAETARQFIDDLSWPLNTRTPEITIKRRGSINNRDGGAPLARTILTSDATGEWMVSGNIAITRNSGGHALYPFVAGRSNVGAAYFADVGAALVNISAPTAPTMAWSGNNLQITIADSIFASVDLIVVISSVANIPGVLTFSGLMGGD